MPSSNHTINLNLIPTPSFLSLSLSLSLVFIIFCTLNFTTFTFPLLFFYPKFSIQGKKKKKMPGLVSVKTPPETPPLRISVPGTPTQAQAQTPTQQRSELVYSVSNSKPASPLPRRPPSPSPSRSKFSPRKPPPDNPNSEAALDNPDLGPFLLKLARDTIASGEGPNKALDYALRASKSFERCSGGAEGEPSLDLAMSLHVLAAIYSSLGRFEEAIPVLERAIQVPDPPRGADHALAAFSGHMQLGDTFSMLGLVDRSIACYEEGLKIQIEALGDTDPRVGETCRFEFSSF